MFTVHFDATGERKELCTRDILAAMQVEGGAELNAPPECLAALERTVQRLQQQQRSSVSVSMVVTFIGWQCACNCNTYCLASPVRLFMLMFQTKRYR